MAKPAEGAPVDVIVLNSHGVGQVCNINRLPHEGESLRAWNWHIAEDGGKGTAICVALGRLGIRSAFVGKVGVDVWGDLGEKWMGGAGADCTYLYRDSAVSTGTGLVMIDTEGRNTIIDGDSSSEALTIEEIDAALDALAPTARWFTTGFAMPERKALAGAQHAKARGLITFLNPSPIPEEPMGRLDYIDFLVVNEVEATLLAGPGAVADPENLARALQSRYGCGTVVITLGEEGSAVLADDEFARYDPIRVNAVDSTGAGDAYLAALIAGFVLGKPLAESCQWATVYSAIEVTRHGTIAAYPTREETEEWIARH